jgi:hypothetical protein
MVADTLLRNTAAAALLASVACLAQSLPEGGALPQAKTPDDPNVTFGVTVFDSTGLEGKLYFLKPGTDSLRNFKRMKPQGTLYATALNVPPQPFTNGFPGITDRFEWFAIDYTGRFWIKQPGVYRFYLLSDDGSKLYIDGKLLIDNDGIHAPQWMERGKQLAEGMHRIRVSYFQGPRYDLALVLGVAGPGEALRVFDTRDFLPPNPDH